MIREDDKGLRKVCAHYEQVENYASAVADKENKWDLHHRREITEMKSRQQLIDEGKYYDVEPEELIFLTKSEHWRLHSENALPETRKKWSDANKGENHPMYGKHHSEETKKKMSNALKGHIRSAETKKKMSNAKKGENHPAFGKHWFNNGEVNIRSKECPGEDFKRGRVRI